jgi:hypothetical protein
MVTMSDDRQPPLILRLLHSWMWEEPMRWKFQSSAAIPWIIRAVLLLVCWRGMSSESGLVSGIALFVFVGLVLSSPTIFRRSASPAVLAKGDTRITLESATWPHWPATERVLHDHLNIHYSLTLDILKSLPVTLEPALVRSQAEVIVKKLRKAGAVASVVTINHNDEPRN